MENSPFQPLGNFLGNTFGQLTQNAGSVIQNRINPATSPLASNPQGGTPMFMRQSMPQYPSIVPSPVQTPTFVPKSPLVPPRMPTPTPTKNPLEQGIVSPLPSTPMQPQQPKPIPQQIISGNPNPAYGNRTYYFEPKLYDAIAKVKEPDIRQLLFALAGQESSGGKNLIGDGGKSWGPYHIHDIRGIEKEKSMDPEWATQYAYNEIKRRVDMGQTPAQALRSWNYDSGYVPSWTNQQGIPQYGPRYDIDLPYMAQTSTFLRGG